jgi:hypothetical protein
MVDSNRLTLYSYQYRVFDKHENTTNFSTIEAASEKLARNQVTVEYCGQTDIKLIATNDKRLFGD